MSIPSLTIISAGAGSGKTYTIQKTLSEWISKGNIDVEKVVAVTFTESAAAELKERITTELVSAKMLEEALKLDSAYISTIHSFGLRIITEFAFDRGISPSPRLLNKAEQEILIRKALAKTDKADTILSNLSAFGYADDGYSGSTGEDRFRSTVLGLIGLFRSIGVNDAGKENDHVKSSIKRVTSAYGKTGNPEKLEKELYQAVTNLLKQFSSSLVGMFPGNKTAVIKFHDDFWNLKRASNKNALKGDWKLWEFLRDMRLSKRGSKLPDGYDDAAQAVMSAANGILEHPGPLNDVITHMKELVVTSTDSMGIYRKSKTDRGLVDFTDMLTLAHDLIAKSPEILETLKSRFDCIIIDEFQDTNPLEFSLLWIFQEAGIPAFIVGDVKQAIMGFRNTDSRLLREIQAQHPENTKFLKSNYRSSPELMEFINNIGDGLFGDGYTKLKPKTQFPDPIAPLETIEFAAGKNKEWRINHVAAYVHKLLFSGMNIYDKKLKKRRRIRGDDIAILSPRHDRLDIFAQALDDLGIRFQRELEGWFESRIIQVAYYSLSYVSNPADAHAALYLSVTELGSKDLEPAISEFLEKGEINDPVLETLYKISEGSMDRSVEALLDEIIYELDLFGVISSWDDPAQARADLLKLKGMADEFIIANREALASGGYYGSGPQTFLSWLNEMVEAENKQSSKRALDEDAVTLATWHSAKGREWPVVVVSGTDGAVKSRFPKFDIVYDNFSNLGTILEKASVEIWPKLALADKNKVLEELLQPGAEDEARNLLYVALTRARERLILECPNYATGKSASYWSILTKKAGLSLSDDFLHIGDKKHKRKRTVIAKDDEVTMDGVLSEKSSAQKFGIRAIKKNGMPKDLTPEAVTPSLLHGGEDGEKVSIQTFTYADPLNIDLDVSGMRRGTLLHRCFEVLSEVPGRIERINELIGYEFNENQKNIIAEHVGKYDEFIANTFSPEKVLTEIPILGFDKNGSVVSGSVDAMIDTGKSFIIMDHKSDKTDDYEAHFSYYLPQLMAYADALENVEGGKAVDKLAINWITYGVVMVATIGER